MPFILRNNAAQEAIVIQEGNNPVTINYEQEASIYSIRSISYGGETYNRALTQIIPNNTKWCIDGSGPNDEYLIIKCSNPPFTEIHLSNSNNNLNNNNLNDSTSDDSNLDV